MNQQVSKGWRSVLLLFFTMNTYLIFRYFQMDFSSLEYLKKSLYFLIHAMLLVNAIVYFYRFYTGKEKHRYHKAQAAISGFYLVFLHSSFFMRLVYDLFFQSFLVTEVFSIDFWFFMLSFFISSYAYMNAKEFKMTPYRIRLNSKDKGEKDFKIIYLSDLHFGVSWDLLKIKNFIQLIQDLELDAVFLGGDIFDEGSGEEGKRELAQLLSEIPSKFGTYYIEGNHEYIDIKSNLQYFRHAGIHILSDQAILLDDSFYLLGRKDNEGSRASLESLLKDVKEDYPVILLDHRPHHQEAIKSEKVDLQISGHTHAGQFLPFSLLNRLMLFFNSYVYGHYQHKGFQLIVSSGLGNWGVPYRLFSKAEFLYLDIQLR